MINMAVNRLLVSLRRLRSGNVQQNMLGLMFWLLVFDMINSDCFATALTKYREEQHCIIQNKTY